jgi:hypothetical protein
LHGDIGSGDQSSLPEKDSKKTAYFIRFYNEFRASFVIAVTGPAASRADTAGVREALFAKLTLFTQTDSAP